MLASNLNCATSNFLKHIDYKCGEFGFVQSGQFLTSLVSGRSVVGVHGQEWKAGEGWTGWSRNLTKQTVPNGIRFTSIYFIVGIHGKLFKYMIAQHLQFSFGHFRLITGFTQVWNHKVLTILMIWPSLTKKKC